MNQSNFIGMGNNPEEPDLPLGLGMRLAQDPKAMDTFSNMTNEQKSALISYLQRSGTGDEALSRMADAVNLLHNNQVTF
ncbi:MAG: hypothetical protein FWH02_02090 [Oscillospiraceae bacterium]|nr:hypothetical protein [Oscillospiraceae bacterium]